MSLIKSRPMPGDAAPYYFNYIDQVPDGDIVEILEAQLAEATEVFGSISESHSRFRYEPGKWSIREVLAHVNDTERLFAFRAFWFARGFETPLPSFDQDIAAAACGAEEWDWKEHVDEFRAIRASTLPLFRRLSPDCWDRRGTASDNPFTVRSLAWIAAGHLNHHLRVLRERYL